ncbi:MAG: TIGR00341 family protein [Verrucomicrobia bacterium]|nr:TIGR00341 family protein [Verrucomicrobiota bacterium]MCH8527993.1 TIGR00341 family protein [Kiritimatiellia bacterium]
MKYIEILFTEGSEKNLALLAEKVKAEDYRVYADVKDGMRMARLLVSKDHLQNTLDTLENLLGAQPTAKVVVLDVETSLPKSDDKKREQEQSATSSRETLYEEISQSAVCNRNHLLLVALSTVVAAIGLMEDNVAVIIGAMVIAPLLGPNLALSLAISLGDISLIRKAFLTSTAGVMLAIALSYLMGTFIPLEDPGVELMTRTHAGVSSATLALASGAAAALSLTTGLSSVLVGVMVAVALLPPAATLGIFLGQGEIHLATGAGILLGINVVCVDIAGNIVFWLKRIRPRNPEHKAQAVRALAVSLIGWSLVLGGLFLLLALRGRT